MTSASANGGSQILFSWDLGRNIPAPSFANAGVSTTFTAVGLTKAFLNSGGLYHEQFTECAGLSPDPHYRSGSRALPLLFIRTWCVGALRNLPEQVFRVTLNCGKSSGDKPKPRSSSEGANLGCTIRRLEDRGSRDHHIRSGFAAENGGFHRDAPIHLDKKIKP